MTEPAEHDPGTDAAPAPVGEPIVPPDASLRTITVVHWGMVLWAVLLVVLLVVPDLRSGDRSWWIWVPVSGLGLGLIGHAYLARGRGNAADA